jgi:NAD+ kinase
MMPIDLVLVRHGESEGNVANKRSRKGDHSAFTDEFKKRHSSQWRLTDKGREQARIAGEWIKENIGEKFDRHFVSEYIRAKETAALLDLPKAKWDVEFYLRERDWGVIDVYSVEERMIKFAEEMARREKNPFLWAAPGGDNMVDKCLHVDRINSTLHRECSDKKVIIVCHGEVIRAYQVRLQRLTIARFSKLVGSKNVFDKIHNCQILHYTRRNPITGDLADKLYWMRSICPTDLSRSRDEWQKIKRRRSTNDDLMCEVNLVTQLIR